MYWYHPDYLGSVEFVTDMRGEAYQFFLNTPWGENVENQFARNYTAFSSRFRFNGKEWDEETGNYYYGARYYDPKISVWLSVDPLAAKFNNLSPYHYTVNNPLNVIDYDGRDTTFGSQEAKDEFDKLYSDLGDRLAKTGEKLEALRAKQAESANADGFWGRVRQRKINKLSEKHRDLLKARTMFDRIIFDDVEFFYSHVKDAPAYSGGGATNYDPKINAITVKTVKGNPYSIIEESRHGVSFLLGEVAYDFSSGLPIFYDWSDEFVAQSLAKETLYHLYRFPAETDQELRESIESYYQMFYINQTWEPQNVKFPY